MIPAFSPDIIFSYLGIGVLGLSVLAFAALSLSLLYHWFTFEPGNRFVQAGALLYVLGSFVILFNVWRTFTAL